MESISTQIHIFVVNLFVPVYERELICYCGYFLWNSNKLDLSIHDEASIQVRFWVHVVFFIEENSSKSLIVNAALEIRLNLLVLKGVEILHITSGWFDQHNHDLISTDP